MAFASVADRDAIENEKPWEARNTPTTTYELLSQTAGKFGSRKAVSFSLLSDPTSDTVLESMVASCLTLS